MRAVPADPRERNRGPGPLRLSTPQRAQREGAVSATNGWVRCRGAEEEEDKEEEEEKEEEEKEEEEEEDLRMSGQLRSAP